MSQLIRTNEHIAMNRSFGTQALNDLLEKALERESKFTTKKSFAPSSLGYNGSCPRFWHYAFNGAMFDYSTDALSMQNMNNGSASGERIAKMFEAAGILVEAEQEVNTIGHETLPPIRGYIDAIVNWKGEEVVVEVKTCRSSTWNTRVLKNEVPEYQMAQLLLYMYLTNHDKGFFFTENKDTHEVFVLPVKMSELNKVKVEGWLDWMRKIYDNKELPVRPFRKSSPQCKGCPVRATCWDGWERGSVNGADPSPGTIELEVLSLS